LIVLFQMILSGDYGPESGGMIVRSANQSDKCLVLRAVDEKLWRWRCLRISWWTASATTELIAGPYEVIATWSSHLWYVKLH